MARKPRTPRTPRSLSPDTVLSPEMAPIADENNNRDSVPTADLSAESDVFILPDEAVSFSEPEHALVRDMFATAPSE